MNLVPLDQKASTKHDYLKLWLKDVLRNQNDESDKNINDKCNKAYSQIIEKTIHIYENHYELNVYSRTTGIRNTSRRYKLF